MRSVKSKGTGPEIVVRKVLRDLGFFYRLNVKNLIGTPDIVFRKYRKIILVNGCFWHGHNCKKGRLPKTNLDFWNKKIMKNTDRDKKVLKELELQGWDILVVWQCETRDTKSLSNMLLNFLVNEVS